jgi:hypothetical protein
MPPSDIRKEQAALNLLCFVLCIVGGCQGCPKPVPTPATDGSMGIDGTDVVSLDGCAKACINLRMIKCPEGDANDGGDSCEVTCRHAQASGLTDLKPTCLAMAQTKAEAVACGTVKCK